MKIAIAGPSGNVGRKVVTSLLAQGGHDLLLLAHKPEKLAAEKARGIKLVQVSSDAVREMLINSGATPDVAGQFVQMYEAREEGRLRFEGPPAAVTVMPTTFEEFARAVLAPALHVPVASR